MLNIWIPIKMCAKLFYQPVCNSEFWKCLAPINPATEKLHTPGKKVQFLNAKHLNTNKNVCKIILSASVQFLNSENVWIP